MYIEDHCDKEANLAFESLSMDRFEHREEDNQPWKSKLEEMATNDKQEEIEGICLSDAFGEPQHNELFDYYVQNGPFSQEYSQVLFPQLQSIPINIEVASDIPTQPIELKNIEPRSEIFRASDLKSKFPEMKFEIKKATNAPKFLYKTFFDKIEDYLAGDFDGDSHLQWLRRYYDHHNSQKTKTRFQLVDLFGEDKSEKKKRRSKVRRGILQLKLATQKVELIMVNNMIPPANKLHYLYFTKVYQWRLNNDALISRFN